MSTATFNFEIEQRVAIVTINRSEKRNALNDALVAELNSFFVNPPKDVRAIVLRGQGQHFCAGLDLSEHVNRSPEEVIAHSRGWQRVMNQVQLGGLPVVCVMQGAVVGGGLELAASAHVRVADTSTFFQLPEGQRGIFVGGGGSVRISRIIGVDRMTEMMLTGRKYDAEDGLRLGLAHYCVESGTAFYKAMDLARQIASNAPLSNYMMIQALGRIRDMAPSEGLFTESLCAALTQSTEEAQEGLAAFLEKRPPRVDR